MRKSILHKTTLLLLLTSITAFSLAAHNGVKVSVKIFLKGALESNGLMRDDLRSTGLLPSTEPYSSLPNFQHSGGGGGETIVSPSVFQVTGNNAIVDWVMVELRSENSITTQVATHAALLQRDGDVVDMDGVSPIHFLVANGKYYVVVRHRNHLGAMTAAPKNLSSQTLLVDFTNPAMPLYGTNACYNNGTVRALWLGNTNADKKVLYQGAGNDRDIVFFKVISAPSNTSFSLSYILLGYLVTDINLDGNTIFEGSNNDVKPILDQQVESCQAGNCNISEQIP